MKGEINTYFEAEKDHPMMRPKYRDKEIASLTFHKLQEHFMGLAKALLDLENKKVEFDPIFSISRFDTGDTFKWTITSKFKEKK